MIPKSAKVLLKELIEDSKGYRYVASINEPVENLWPILVVDGDVQQTFYDSLPWIVEDYPGLEWQGNYFFHRGHGEIYLVEGTLRDFNNSIYRCRLRAFKKLVAWAYPNPIVGFTVVQDVTEVWGYYLCNPWLVRSTKNLWYNRLKLFSALNKYNPQLWPMSLLLEHWQEFRKIML